MNSRAGKLLSTKRTHYLFYSQMGTTPTPASAAGNLEKSQGWIGSRGDDMPAPDHFNCKGGISTSHEAADTFDEATFKAARKTSVLIDEVSADSVPSYEHALLVPVLAVYYRMGHRFSGPVDRPAPPPEEEV
ncbi:hypothetical protein M404DRAFT_883570 [Pisolithus tinctorius Marx 270]|uniref:Uncharacterized protein n=1 Tax=Pisolithus tinctorius Marx 270 TaxID=870435 RepID=A0A0C3PQX7_PISTI|nr:hypothetical protein M404DRAFT_883570 [Pisolithus tinctorius Marx 270]